MNVEITSATVFNNGVAFKKAASFMKINTKTLLIMKGDNHKMNNTFHKTRIASIDTSAFGGIVYKGDFDEYHSISDMASRILSDWRFDKQCRNNAEIRDNKEQL